MGWTRALSRYFGGFSVEPVFMVFMFGYAIKNGAGVIEQLILDKACLYKLDYPVEVCQNLSAEANEDYELEVQRVVNNFNLYATVIETGLSSVVALFIGSFADRFGMRACVQLGLLGALIADLVDYVNYYWFAELPLEFLWIEQVVQSLYAGFYVGIYGIIANHSEVSDRAFKLARMDAGLTIIMIFGFALANPVFEALSYYKTYAINTASIVLGSLYTQFVVKEHKDGNYVIVDVEKQKKREAEKREKGLRKTYGSAMKQKVKDVFWQPIVDLQATVFKPREHGQTTFLVLSLICMALYSVTINEFRMMYPFLKYKYDVSYSEYSLFNVISSSMNLISLTVLMPVMVYLLKLHETTILTLTSIVGGFGVAAASAANTLIPGFLLSYSVANLRYCCNPAGRSLVTRIVDKEEIGRTYAVVSLLTTLFGLIGTIVYRLVYDFTLETYSGAFLLLSAFCYWVAGLITFFLFTQRKHLGHANDAPVEAIQMEQTSRTAAAKEREANEENFDSRTSTKF